jgi:hypothetical protein
VTQFAPNATSIVDITQRLNVAKVGINYKFSGPLIAKY